MKTLTIGIPAYNEEANIARILSMLVKQESKGFIIQKIIVASDGSSDSTVAEAKKVLSKKIVIIDGSERKGATYRQNQIMNRTKTDCLVLLNADIVINDTLFINKLAKPVISDTADLTSSVVEPLKPQNTLQSILYASHILKNDIYESIKHGNNLYTCHGAARAFSKRLYTSFRFQDRPGEDAYSYLFAKRNNFRYKYISNAVCYIQLPGSFRDHKKQSVRYLKSSLYMGEFFDTEFLSLEYNLPFRIRLMKTVKHLVIKPLEITMYIAIYYAMNVVSFLTRTKETGKWAISTSSKKIK